MESRIAKHTKLGNIRTGEYIADIHLTVGNNFHDQTDSRRKIVNQVKVEWKVMLDDNNEPFGMTRHADRQFVRVQYKLTQRNNLPQHGNLHDYILVERWLDIWEESYIELINGDPHDLNSAIQDNLSNLGLYFQDDQVFMHIVDDTPAHDRSRKYVTVNCRGMEGTYSIDEFSNKAAHLPTDELKELLSVMARKEQSEYRAFNSIVRPATEMEIEAALNSYDRDQFVQ